SSSSSARNGWPQKDSPSPMVMGMGRGDHKTNPQAYVIHYLRKCPEKSCRDSRLALFTESAHLEWCIMPPGCIGSRPTRAVSMTSGKQAFRLGSHRNSQSADRDCERRFDRGADSADLVAMAVRRAKPVSISAVADIPGSRAENPN